jgi:hypothetical protein
MAAASATVGATVFLGLAAGGLCAGCGDVPPRPAVLSFAGAGAPDLTSQARSVVRLRIQDSSMSLVRSGVLVGERGYVLTAFSNVGVTGVRTGRAATVLGAGGRPGTLYAGGEDIRVEVFDSPYRPEPTEYVARVVRGDMRLNLALLRIVAAEDGPLPPGQEFAAVPLDAAAPPAWGQWLWVIGASVQGGLHVGSNVVAQGILNSQGTMAGYYLGMLPSFVDGAPAYDAEGRLVGIMQSSFLRPAERVPRSWLDEMRGEIVDRRIDGMPLLRSGEWTEVDLVGDTFRTASLYEEAPEGSVEDFLFTVPNQSPGTVRVEPPVDIVALESSRVLGSGVGELFVPSENDVFVVVRFPRSEDPSGLSFRVLFTAEER